MPTQSEEELIRRRHYHAYKIADGKRAVHPDFCNQGSAWKAHVAISTSSAVLCGKILWLVALIFNGWPAVSLIPVSVHCFVRTGEIFCWAVAG